MSMVFSRPQLVLEREGPGRCQMLALLSPFPRALYCADESTKLEVTVTYAVLVYYMYMYCMCLPTRPVSLWTVRGELVRPGFHTQSHRC